MRKNIIIKYSNYKDNKTKNTLVDFEDIEKGFIYFENSQGEMLKNLKKHLRI